MYFVNRATIHTNFNLPPHALRQKLNVQTQRLCTLECEEVWVLHTTSVICHSFVKITLEKNAKRRKILALKSKKSETTRDLINSPAETWTDCEDGFRAGIDLRASGVGNKVSRETNPPSFGCFLMQKLRSCVFRRSRDNDLFAVAYPGRRGDRISLGTRSISAEGGVHRLCGNFPTTHVQIGSYDENHLDLFVSLL